MKKIIITLIILFVCFLVYQRVFNGDKIDKANLDRAKADSTKRANEPKESNDSKIISVDTEAVLKDIRKEQKVKEAIITDANVLYAAVIDDGTRRNGYADYLCQVLKEHNITNVRVKVVKFGSTNDPKRYNAYGILLGESWCK